MLAPELLKVMETYGKNDVAKKFVEDIMFEAGECA